MTTHTIYETAPSGRHLFAVPAGFDYATWDAADPPATQVEATEGTGANAGRYAFSLDDSVAEVWATHLVADDGNGAPVTDAPTPDDYYSTIDLRPARLDAPISTRATPGDVQAASPAGDGDTAVNHDTGGTDNLRLEYNGNGIDNASIRAFLKSEFDADPTSATLRAGPIYTGADGRWVGVMMLNAGLTYTLVFARAGYNATTKEVTP